MRLGVLRVPAAGVGVLLPAAELVFGDERLRSGSPRSRGLRVGNARYERPRLGRGVTRFEEGLDPTP